MCRGGALALAALLALSGAAGGLGQRPEVRPGARRAAKPRPVPADNSYCLVCHANLKSEPLAKSHQRAGVGCARCHGESDRHSSDENNVIPPDIMYPAGRIAAACLKCHPTPPTAKPAARAAHAAYRGPRPAAGPCTACHGAHRLPVRTRRWDRGTGKLIKDDGVRMLPDGKPGKG